MYFPIKLRTGLVCTSLLVLTACGGGSSTHSPQVPVPPPPSPPQSTTIMAGTAKLNISPPEGQTITLSGYSGRGPMVGIHDELYVRALALSDGTDTAIYVSSDQLRVNASDFADMHDELDRRNVVLPIENIFVTATHTHGAPETGNPPNAETASYQEERIAQTIDAMEMAYSNLQPAEIRVGHVEIQGFNNNRQEIKFGPLGNPYCDLGQDRNGTSDKQVQFADILDSSGTSIASIVVAGVHSTAMGQHNRYVTGDFAGAASLNLETLKGNDHISLWMMGGGGDQSPEYFHQNTEAFNDPIRSPEGQTREFSEKVDVAMLNAPLVTNFDIQTEVDLVELPLKDGKLQARAIYGHSWNEDIVLLGTHFELFSETVMNLRAESGFDHTFILSKTNGSGFYLPTESSAGQGCYENNIALFPESAEPMFRSTAMDMMETLHNKAAQ